METNCIIPLRSVYVPPDLTFINSTYCPQNSVICFIWISEQTAIVSLYTALSDWFL